MEKFNDDILNGYIDKAIKNNYDLKWLLAVDEYYQAIKVQFANELHLQGPVWTRVCKNAGDTAFLGFCNAGFVNYEVDLFLKIMTKQCF